jgi:hypothetical protein
LFAHETSVTAPSVSDAVPPRATAALVVVYVAEEVGLSIVTVGGTVAPPTKPAGGPMCDVAMTTSSSLKYMSGDGMTPPPYSPITLM